MWVFCFLSWTLQTSPTGEIKMITITQKSLQTLYFREREKERERVGNESDPGREGEKQKERGGLMSPCRETRLLISACGQKVDASSPQGHTQPLLSCGGPPPLHLYLLPHLLSAPKSKKPEPGCSNWPDDICGLFVCLQVSGVNSHSKPPDRLFLIPAWVWLHLQSEKCSLERCVFETGNWDT